MPDSELIDRLLTDLRPVRRRSVLVNIYCCSLGVFVFMFARPSDDPLYIAVWYAVGCGLVTLVVRLLLPPPTL